MQWITVKEFCEQYGISHQCVYKKLDSSKYYYDLMDHVEKRGNAKYLDEVAVETLRPKKNGNASHKNENIEVLREQLSACETMCKEQGETITALSDRLSILEEQVRNITDQMNDSASGYEKRFAHIEENMSALVQMILKPEPAGRSQSVTPRDKTAGIS